MQKKRLDQFKYAFTLAIIIELFPGNPNVEKAVSQSQMTVAPQQVTPQVSSSELVFPIFPLDLCEQIFVTQVPLRNLCKQMELENLPNLGGLKNEDFVALTQSVLTPVEIFQNPDAFRKITKNPEELAHKLGFESVEQLANIQPGGMTIIGWVRLTPLSNYKDGDDPKKIIIFSDSVILPLNDNSVLDKSKDAMSSLTFTLLRKENEWRWTRRGLPNFIRKIDEYGSNQPEQKLVVDIPGLNLRFLGESQDSQLMLTPLRNIKFATLELKAGQPLPANEVFTGLVPEAKNILEVPDDVNPRGASRGMVH